MNNRFNDHNKSNNYKKMVYIYSCLLYFFFALTGGHINVVFVRLDHVTKKHGGLKRPPQTNEKGNFIRVKLEPKKN